MSFDWCENSYNRVMVNKRDTLHRHVSKSSHFISFPFIFHHLCLRQMEKKSGQRSKQELNKYIVWNVFYPIDLDAELCHLFTNYIIKSGISPIQGLKVLAQAIDKIRLFDSQLTPVHADLFQLSLCAKVFNPALKFLDIDITAISTTDVSAESMPIRNVCRSFPPMEIQQFRISFSPSILGQQSRRKIFPVVLLLWWYDLFGR